MNERETVSVWVGEGRWVSIPVGTPEHPLTDEEVRQARFVLDAEAMDRGISEGGVCPECDGDGFTPEGRAGEASGDSTHLTLSAMYCPKCHGSGTSALNQEGLSA